MALFSCICPRCGRPTLLDANGVCVNSFNKGGSCGFSIPIKYVDGNSKFRDKFKKHTSAAVSGSPFDLSWVAHSGDYSFYQQFTLASGAVFLDKANNYLFLWSTPSGEQPIARLYYADGGTVVNASGTIMPLNSKIQHLHHFYGNREVHHEHIADGTGLLIEAPSQTQSDYRVFDRQGGNLLYSYNPVTRSGQRFATS